MKKGSKVRIKSSPFGRYCRGTVESVNGDYAMVRMNYNKSLYEALKNELSEIKGGK